MSVPATDVCFGDCLKLTKHSQNLPSESAQSIKEVNSTEEAKISGKRSSLEAELEETESPVKRKKTNLVYKAGANWSVWDLVWVRRKQVTSDQAGRPMKFMFHVAGARAN